LIEAHFYFLLCVYKLLSYPNLHFTLMRMESRVARDSSYWFFFDWTLVFGKSKIGLIKPTHTLGGKKICLIKWLLNHSDESWENAWENQNPLFQSMTAYVFLVLSLVNYKKGEINIFCPPLIIFILAQNIETNVVCRFLTPTISVYSASFEIAKYKNVWLFLFFFGPNISKQNMCVNR